VARRKEPQPPPADPSPGRRFWRRRARGSGTEPAAELSPAASEQERLILEALHDLRDMDVREVMTPRVDVTTLTIPVHAEDIARAVAKSGHSSFPVVHDDLDDLVGILYVNDLFRSGRHPASDEVEPGPLDISRRLRQPYLVPESRRVLDALAEMRRQHRAFAVVVDEYGGVAGVLTVKDLLEPLVGDLRDEFDAEDEPDIVRVDRRRWLIDGRASVDDVRDRLAIEIPDGEYVTLGGFLFDAFGHIPEAGEELSVGDWDLRVEEMDKRRVAKVVARDNAPQEETDGPAEAAGAHPAIVGDRGSSNGTPTGPRDRPAPVGTPSGRSEGRE